MHEGGLQGWRHAHNEQVRHRPCQGQPSAQQLLEGTPDITLIELSL